FTPVSGCCTIGRGDIVKAGVAAGRRECGTFWAAGPRPSRPGGARLSPLPQTGLAQAAHRAVRM
ncbi:hypothetical protein, partial [Streptomyces sp. NPDC050121]|uniref:hypothetical protein n=1 Tax=Streptomyces sp. NPDC050121 TaxID=3365601 RepID=UPI0037ACA445